MEENVIAGVVYCVVSLFGLLMYVFVFYYLATHPKECKKTFYKLLIQLSIADCGLLALNGIYSPPCTIAGYQVFGETAGFYIANTDTLFFYTTIMTTLLISLHRLAVVVPLRSLLDTVFEGWGLYGVMSCCWVAGVAMTVASNALNCPKLYNEQFFFFGYFCHNQTQEVVDSMFNSMLVLNLGSTTIMAVFYAATFAVLVASRKQISDSETQKRRIQSERRLLYQSFIIWLVLTYEVCSFLTIPRYMPNFAGTLITSLGVIVNASLNPALCLIFHKDIRTSTLYLLMGFKKSLKPQVAPTSVFMTTTRVVVINNV